MKVKNSKGTCPQLLGSKFDFSKTAIFLKQQEFNISNILAFDAITAMG